MIATALVLTTATPALADGPAVRFTLDVAGSVISCQTTDYAVASGELAIVVHDGPAAQGNQNFTLTATPHNVVAVDSEGNEYSVRAFWFGGTLKVNTGGERATFTSKLQIVAPGQGTVDSVNLTLDVTAQPNNFVLEEFDPGSCEDPG